MHKVLQPFINATTLNLSFKKCSCDNNIFYIIISNVNLLDAFTIVINDLNYVA